MSKITSPQRFCPHCGSAVSTAARFCGSCGRTLPVSGRDETIVSAWRRPQPPPGRAKPRRRIWGWLVGCTLIIVVGVVAVISLGLAADRFLSQTDWPAEPVSIGDDSPAPAEVIPPTPAPVVVASQTQTIGPEGGVIALEDGGSRLVIPAGAVAAATAITLNQLDPQPWLAGDYNEGIALEARAPVDQFQQNVEFRVLLPDGFSAADADYAAVWLVETAGGGLIYQPAAVQVTDGRPELVVETDHFSTRIFSWFKDRAKAPPPQAGPLAVPYFNQGGIFSGGQATGVCWAASIQMITEAAGHIYKDDEIYTLLGRLQLSPQDGLGPIEAKTNSTLAGILTTRTGQAPVRKSWLAGSGAGAFNGLVSHLKAEIGLGGRPVMVVNSAATAHDEAENMYLNHAYVIVGYDNWDNFYVHNPAAIGSSDLTYKLEPLTRLKLDSAGLVGAKSYTLISIPKALAANRPLVSLNLMDSSFQFVQPNTNSQPGDLYMFKWDYTQSEGYSFQSLREQKTVDLIPPEVTHLQLAKDGGGLEVINATWPGEAKRVSVDLEIVGRGPAKTHTSRTLLGAVPAGGGWKIKHSDLVPIPVAEFRDPDPQPVRYEVTVRLMVDGQFIDQAAFAFTIGPEEGYNGLLCENQPASKAEADLAQANCLWVNSTDRRLEFQSFTHCQLSSGPVSLYGLAISFDAGGAVNFANDDGYQINGQVSQQGRQASLTVKVPDRPELDLTNVLPPMNCDFQFDPNCRNIVPASPGGTCSLTFSYPVE